MNKLMALAVVALASALPGARAEAGDAATDMHWKAGLQVGTVHEGGKYEPVLQYTFGYQVDRTWSVEALLAVNLLFMRSGIADPAQPYEFDRAYGARVLATWPVGDRWRLVGGVGVADVHELRGLLAYGRDRVGVMVSGAAMYQVGRRTSLGVEASSYTQSSTANLGLRGEMRF